MENLKEWLNTKTFEYKQAACMFGHSEWIEIPEGAEIAIKFKDDPDEFGVIFYKNNGKSSFSQKGESWHNESNWTMKDLLDENYCEDGIDLSHDVLWQRATQPEELPFIDDEPRGLNDQYAEIEQVRQQTIEQTLAERQSTYGNFEDVAFVTESIMSTLAKARASGWNDLPHTHRMALYMIASKMARIVNGDFNHLDSWHDIGGYSKLIEKLIKGE